jgi:hypothetical protein
VTQKRAVNAFSTVAVKTDPVYFGNDPIIKQKIEEKQREAQQLVSD